MAPSRTVHAPNAGPNYSSLTSPHANAGLHRVVIDRKNHDRNARLSLEQRTGDLFGAHRKEYRPGRSSLYPDSDARNAGGDV
jgi:hypothetical protein